MLLLCEFVKDVQRGRSTIKCHTGTIDAAWTSCKQFIPNSLGARHKDVMLYAKMWQWRFINKYKKLLEKTAEMLRKIEWKKDAWICPIEIEKKIVFNCSENTISPKNTQIWTSKFATFQVTQMVASLWQNTHFFCKTLFSWARFSIRRDVFVQWALLPGLSNS